MLGSQGVRRCLDADTAGAVRHVAPMAIERATDGYSASCLTRDNRTDNASRLSFSATFGEESEVKLV